MSDRVERVIPFSNGCQHSTWEDRNCARCAKSDLNTIDGKGCCDVLDDIVNAFWTDGTMDAGMAKRMGYEEPGLKYTWDCPERKDVTDDK